MSIIEKHALRHLSETFLSPPPWTKYVDLIDNVYNHWDIANFNVGFWLSMYSGKILPMSCGQLVQNLVENMKSKINRTKYVFNLCPYLIAVALRVHTIHTSDYFLSFSANTNSTCIQSTIRRWSVFFQSLIWNLTSGHHLEHTFHWNYMKIRSQYYFKHCF